MSRARITHPDAPLADQVRAAVRMLHERGALREGPTDARTDTVPPTRAHTSQRAIAVIAEPDRPHATRELLGVAARLAAEIDSRVVAITLEDPKPAVLGAWGADAILHLVGGGATSDAAKPPLRGESDHRDGPNIEEDVAHALTGWAAAEQPWSIITGSTAWGREVASRVAARLEAGLTGDAVDLEVGDGRLVAWKPAFGGQLIAAIGATSAVQMATVRAGMITASAPRVSTIEPPVRRITMSARGRVRVLARTREDNLDALAEAHTVIGLGRGVAPSEYDALDPLVARLGAELSATRKVTDEGWLPRSRQVGITGRSIAPRLFVSIGASGKFNHTIGVRAARTVLAINSDPNAPIFEAADAGIVGDWREVLPLLVAEFGRP